MRKIYLLLALIAGAAQGFSQPLFTYGNNAVGKEEFLRAYNKNKTPVTEKEKSLREYLDLYSKFKLKVKAAKELRLDTLQQLKYDVQNFSSQVQEGYMNDEKGMNALVDQAIERSQKDIHVIHFSVPFNSGMNAADSAKAFKAMEELSGALKAGREDYAIIAQEAGKKYTPVKENDLGYITALTLPYAVENIIYDLKPGTASAPYRTKSAVHIFKNISERKSAGRWKVAQVLFAIPPGATTEKLKTIENKADSVYNLIKGGADFAEMAKQYSEDKITYLNGGEMPEFGTGKFDLAFESKVFALTKDGEISKPFLTDHGYHIVKRLQQRETVSDKSDEGFVYSIKQLVSQDTRANTARATFLKEVLQKIGYKRSPLLKDAELFRYADSVSNTNEVGKYPINNKTLFSFTKSGVKGLDWLNFVKDYKLNADVYKGENNAALLDKYLATAAFDYYRQHLEEYNEEFKYQMQEFREGNMLFEIMERNVWSKASGDSAGLKKYYDSNKRKYVWAASATVLLFNCSNLKAAQEATTAIGNGKNWKLIAEESQGRIQADSGRYEIAQLQLPEGTNISEGLISVPVVNSNDNTSSFVQILNLFPANQQRSFEEARGLVINDYQNFLEEKWIEELKKKYPVKVNESVFQSLLK